MGATNNIKGSNITLKLVGLDCPQCLQKFTEQEITDENFELWFDTTNDVKLTPMEEVKDDKYYFPFGRKGYQLTIWVRSIEHSYCPDSSLFEICEDCDERFLKEKMKELQEGDYYCKPCYQQIKDHHE